MQILWPALNKQKEYPASACQLQLQKQKGCEQWAKTENMIF